MGNGENEIENAGYYRGCVAFYTSTSRSKDNKNIRAVLLTRDITPINYYYDRFEYIIIVIILRPLKKNAI